MTLPCNASMEIYPDNRIGNYTTSLAREVILDGEWEVGLAECVLPVPKLTHDFIEPILYAELSREKIKQGAKIVNEIISAPRVLQTNSKYMQTLSDLREHSNDFPLTENEEREAFKITAPNKRVIVSVAQNYVLIWDERNKNLSNMLGFHPYGIMSGVQPGYTEYVAPMPFGGKVNIFFVFVYCNLVEYNYVGDSMAPCLRTLPISPGEQNTTILRFENPHYVPLAFSRFSEVSIEIANELGEEVHFAKGLSLIKLHFRPKKR